MKFDLKFVLILMFLELIILGGVLALVQKSQYSQQTIMVQTNLCPRTVNLSLLPNQAVEYDCTFITGSWAVVSLVAKRPLVMLITVLEAGNVKKVVYNSSASVFSLNFPSFANSSVAFQLKNYQPSSVQVQGSLNVYILTPQSATLRTLVYPYRPFGISVVGASLLALVFLILDPKGYASSAVERLSELGGRGEKQGTGPQGG